MRRPSLLVILCVLAAPLPGWTQEAPSAMAPAVGESETGLQEVVVTATKRKESVQRVPMSITAISGEQLRDMGVEQVGDLTKLTPGLQFGSTAYGTAVYSIRGVGYNDWSIGATPTVSVYVDEAPLPYGQMTPIALLDVQRVEVLKGPQGTLFGQNSTGGAINFIASKPTQEFSAGSDVTVDNFGKFQGSAYVSGPITQQLGMRVAVKGDEGGAWQRSYTNGRTLGAADDLYARVITNWKPADWARVSLNVNTFRDKGYVQATQYRFLTPATPASLVMNVPQLLSYPVAPNGDRAADWDPENAPRNDNHQTQGVLRTDIDFMPGQTLTTITDYAAYGEDQVQNPDGVTLDNFEATTHAQIHSFSQEVRVSGAATPQVHYIAGANYQRNTVDQKNFNTFRQNSNAFLLLPFGGLIADTRDISLQETRDRAVFGNIDYQFLPAFTAHSGIRYTQHDINFAGCTADSGDGEIAPVFTNFYDYIRSLDGQAPLAPIPPGGCVSLGPGNTPMLYTQQFDQHNVSWRTGLDWSATEEVMFYVNVSRGYKSGSFPVFPASETNQLTPVSQESVLAYEAGIKGTFLDRTLRIDAASFFYDYRDKQVLVETSVPIFGPLQRLVNVPKSRIGGVEAQLTWLPLSGLTLSLNGTYIDTRVQQGVGGAYDVFGNPIVLTGEALPLTPRWQADLDAHYEWLLSSRLIAFAGSHVSAQSRTNGGFGDSVQLDIAGYTLVDLDAGIGSADDRWRVRLWGRNVADRYYWTNAQRIGDTSVRLTGRPATYGITVSVRLP